MSRRVLTLARAFGRDARGAYAVEFGIVGFVLVLGLIGLAQFVLVLLTRDTLAASLQTATRAVLTGQFQRANAGASDPQAVLAILRGSVCEAARRQGVVGIDCDNLMVDLKVATSFAGSAGSPAIDPATGTWSPEFGTNYACAGPRRIAVVRAALKVPLLAPGFGFGLSAFADGAMLVQAASAFRVEQYRSSNADGC